MIKQWFVFVFLLSLGVFFAQAAGGSEFQRGLARLPAGDLGRQKLALVVGNQRYEFSPLRHAAKDARQVAEALKKQGFEVILELNLTKAELSGALHRFGQRLKQSPSEAVFYYSGHGLEVNGVNYLLPVNNGSIFNEIGVQNEGLPLQTVMDTLEIDHNLSVIIVDACRNNPYKAQEGYRALTGQGFSKVAPATGMLVAYSTSPGEMAVDKNSYTQRLVDVLNQSCRTPLRIEDAFMEIGKRMARDAAAQVPWYLSSVNGKFYFGQSCEGQPPLPDPEPGPAAIPAGGTSPVREPPPEPAQSPPPIAPLNFPAVPRRPSEQNEPTSRPPRAPALQSASEDKMEECLCREIMRKLTLGENPTPADRACLASDCNKR